MKQSLPLKIRLLLRDTYKNIWDDDLALQSAGIAFYTIFSAAPLLVILVWLMGLFFNRAQTSQYMQQFISQLTGSGIAQSLIDVSQTSNYASSGFLTSAVTVIVLLFGATAVITQLKSSLNAIWEIEPLKANSILLYLFNRLLALIIILMLGVLLFISLLLENGARFFSNIIKTHVPFVLTPAFPFIPLLISIIMSIIFFTLVYKILPDVHARWRDIAVGACATTFLFMIGKYVVGLYLANSSLQASYKTAGSFVIFLIWIYYNVQIILVGAEFTQTYARLFGQDLQSSTTYRILPWD